MIDGAPFARGVKQQAARKVQPAASGNGIPAPEMANLRHTGSLKTGNLAYFCRLRRFFGENLLYSPGIPLPLQP